MLPENILKLYQWGHLWSADPLLVDKLSPTDSIVIEAIRSFQEFMQPQLDQLTYIHHNRKSQADGIVGPATNDLFLTPRCDCPDYPNPLATKKAGSGSWPKGCSKDYPDFHSVVVAVKHDSMPDFYKSIWEELTEVTVREYARIGIAIIFKDWSHRDNAQIEYYWRSFGGGIIGMAEFNNASCNDSVFCSISRSFNADMGRLINLTLHELGHNMNLEHTRGGIMNPSINNSPNTWIDDPSFNTLKRFFGGEPIPYPSPKPNPTDPTNPDPSINLVLDGVISVKLYNKILGEFVFVPKEQFDV